MPNCRLCGSDKPLQDSHIIPAFAGRWLKETGATVYLRTASTPNKRAQDLTKVQLLCTDCESLFCRHESEFANKIFYPFVNSELDYQGKGTGKIKEFDYGPWLLHFIISLHWRDIVSDIEDLRKNPHAIEFEPIWRNFLLGKTNYTGKCESHMVFLQNLTAATRFPGIKLGTNVNTYILRSTDSTTVSSEYGKFGVYAKIGPIALYTSIVPSTLKGNGDSRIHMRGPIKCGQKLRNKFLNNFIFIGRPNELAAHTKISEKQNKKIQDEALKDPAKTFNSLSHQAYIADLQMKRNNQQ